MSVIGYFLTNCAHARKVEQGCLCKSPSQLRGEGGAILFKTLEEDAEQNARVNGKFEERSGQWQVGQAAQNQERPGENL